MRVLQVNKFFYPRAGAETAFLQTRALLLERGEHVLDFSTIDPANVPSPYAAHFAPHRSYDGSAKIAARVRDAASALYSRTARKRLAGLLDEHEVDVAHLHNVYHQLTLSVVDELAARGIPIVLTLHDWKVACPAYTLFTDGAPCRRCPQSGVHNAVLHRCVKGSVAASAIAAAEALVARRRGTYAKVSAFIAPSRFGTEVAALAGLPAERVHLVPNFLSDAELATTSDAPAHDRHARVVYAGRLEVTKGLLELLAAFEQVRGDVELRIAGDGPLEAAIRARAAEDPRITVLGRLSREQVLAEYAVARAVVLPSIWEDNGPFAVLEAQACGTPLIVTDRGGPSEFVRDGETGLVVDPGDGPALTAAIEHLALDAGRSKAMGDRARDHVRREHTEQRHYEQLMEVYGNAIRDQG